MFKPGDKVTARLRFWYWNFIWRRVEYEDKLKKATVTAVYPNGIYRVKLGFLDGRSCLAHESDLTPR